MYLCTASLAQSPIVLIASTDTPAWKAKEAPPLLKLCVENLSALKPAADMADLSLAIHCQ
jgi:hypothetical protein